MKTINIGIGTLIRGICIEIPFPNPLFFDIPAHVSYLESMARDLKHDERWLLLIGNQGTGKNKLVDRLLHLLQWPREYMQLHRDTSIQSLTTVPTILITLSLVILLIFEKS